MEHPLVYSGSTRDYTSISPSARSLLLVKGHTGIPYARELAEKIAFPEKYEADCSSEDFSFLATVMHFENRYSAINQLLNDLPISNMLELASGYSFRGLQLAHERADLHFIDTDLPEIIGIKSLFINQHNPAIRSMNGSYELLSLNALDAGQFNAVSDLFPQGELAVINEGLLVYFTLEEKIRLCSIIHRILTDRGGCWINADIYIKPKLTLTDQQCKEPYIKFMLEHHVFDQMFESYEQAEDFFRQQGFMLEREAKPDYQQLSGIHQLIHTGTAEQLRELQLTGKIRATWQLRCC